MERGNHMAANPNKLVANVGNLSLLKTGAKDSLVSAINELQATGGGGTYSSVHVTTTAEIADNSQITVPLSYQVGNGSLLVFCLGEKLIKADPDNNIDGHYIEIGNSGAMSNKIQLYNIGQSVPIGTAFEFMVPSGYNS